MTREGVGSCAICEKARCDCPRNYSSKGSYQEFIEKMMGKKKQRRVSFAQDVRKSSMERRVNFTYNTSANVKGRSHSFSIPLSQQQPYIARGERKQEAGRWVLKNVTHHIEPIEEIFYYPVVHNRIKYVNPETPQRQAKVNQSMTVSSKKKSKRSYMTNSMANSINRFKDTSDTRNPMTPEQFKRFSSWLKLQ